MATAPAVAMARSHQADQVRQAAAVQAALSALWDETIDPNDLTRSFDRFRERATPLIGTGRVLAERKATDYYRTLLAHKGLDASDLTDLAKPPYPVAAIKASLSGASGKHLGKADFLARRGLPNDAVLALAKADMLGSAKRQIINSSRSQLIALSRAHKKIKGWARVSDGNPCGFCAMLVGRGPVYAEDTASFDSHDRCGCSVRLVTYDEEDGGWTEDAKAYRWAYENGYQDVRQLSAEQLRIVNAARRAAGRREKRSTLMSARWINGYTSDDILRLYADDLARQAVEEAEAIARAAAAAAARVKVTRMTHETPGTPAVTSVLDAGLATGKDAAVLTVGDTFIFGSGTRGWTVLRIFDNGTIEAQSDGTGSFRVNNTRTYSPDEFAKIKVSGGRRRGRDDIETGARAITGLRKGKAYDKFRAENARL